MGNPQTGSLTNSVDPDEMSHRAAFHQGVHFLFCFCFFRGGGWFDTIQLSQQLWSCGDGQFIQPQLFPRQA